MSTVKYIGKPKKPLKVAIDYAFKCREDGAPVFCQGLPEDPEGAYSEMISHQTTYGYKGKQKYRSIVYSFSENEAKKLSIDQMLDIGKSFAREAFPGHQFVMGMHNDTKNPHFHIYYNISHSETGKLIKHTLEVKRLRSLNDKILRERGLKNLKEYNKKNLSREEQLSMKKNYDLENQRRKYGNIRFVRDLKQKANAALSIATDFNEYAVALNSFDINIRVENKNITYFYPGRKKGVRGKYLSSELDKNGLAQVFNQNFKKFTQNPGLRTFAREKHEDFRTGKVTFEQREKELQGFTSEHRKRSRYHSYQKELLNKMLVPESEIKKAKNQSLSNYLKKNKIETTLNEKGQKVLKGKEFVIIKENSWINTKNKTQGNIIDFVSLHKRITYLESLARLNKNPKLRLLSRELNEAGFTYTSFHVPKEKRGSLEFTLKQVNDLLRNKDVSSKMVKKLIESRKVQVDKEGDIYFLDADETKGSYVYSKDKNEQWNIERKGNPTGVFLKKQTKSSKLIVFDNLFSFLKRNQSFSSYNSAKDSILVLANKNKKAIDLFLVENPQVSEISFYTEEDKDRDKLDSKFVRDLKKRLSHFDIRFSTTREIMKGRSRSLELSL